MEENSLKYFEKLLAEAKDDIELTRVSLYEVHLPWNDFSTFPHRFFVVNHVEECDSMCWSHIFNDLRSALGCFGKEARRKFRYYGSDEKHPVYEPVKYCDDWMYYREELFPYVPEECEKDYGPSNPWDAPGMKISDFIKGVY